MPLESKSAVAAKPFTCLIIDDDTSFSTMTAGVVRQEGGEPTLCATIAVAQEEVAHHAYDLLLLDNHLPDGKGYDFFGKFARRQPEIPVIMLTGMPDLAEAVALTRNGLFDYLTKPVDIDTLAACLRRALLRLRSREVSANSPEGFESSPSMREVMTQLEHAARHPASTVLFIGETGTGKDLAVRTLHRLTHPRGNAPYIPVNCAALPAEMFESELFGAERGAYTGADKRRTGLVSAASGGTLFLDEIAEVPLPLQSKLLRLLESREYRALGSTTAETFNGRFTAATNKPLAEEVKAGRFREDLLYRLDVMTITLPPLRERREDLPELTERLLTQLVLKYDRVKPLIKPEDLTALASHSFPGNVRELRNILERSLLKTASESHWLTLDRNWEHGAGVRPRAISTAQSPHASPPPSIHALPAGRTLTPIETQEYRLIAEALAEAKGGIRRAAAKLDMSPQALLRRLEKWPELRPNSGGG